MKLPTRLVVGGGPPVTLNPTTDFIGQGGQAVIYKVGNGDVAKLYIDAAETDKQQTPVLKPEMLSQGDMIGKLKALTALKDDRIVAPKALVTTDKGKPLGYTMAWVKGEPLPVLFTNTFWQQQGWKGIDAVKLAESMREAVAYAHGHKALMADGNPLNYLAVQKPDKSWSPRFIDVDAWQIQHWPANAYHDLTRDPLGRGFTEQTDWFAWGVVAFELLFGTHPYLGQLDGFKRNDFKARMQAGKSVFADGVKLGGFVREFTLCPPVMLKWFRDTFQGGQRSTPPSFHGAAPSLPVAAMVARITTVATQGTLEFVKIFGDASDAAEHVYPCGVVRLASGKLVDLATQKTIGTALSPRAEVVRLTQGWLLADMPTFGQPAFSWLNADKPAQPMQLPLRGEAFVQAANRLFLATTNGLHELKVMVMGTGVLAKALIAPGKLWPAMANGTRWFTGCGIQQTLGQTFLLMPHGPMGYSTIPVPELKGLVPLAAHAAGGYAEVIAQNRRTGVYTRFGLRFNAAHNAYVMEQEDVPSAEQNLAVLPDGSYLSIPADGELEVTNITTGKRGTYRHRNLTTALKLAAWNTQPVYLHNGDLWRLTAR